MKEAVAILLAAHSDLLTRMGGWKGGLVLMIGTFLAGVGAQSTIAEFSGHEGRLQEIEEYHDSIAGPALELVPDMNARQDTVFLRLDGIETLLWCLHYNVNPCPQPSPAPPTRRE